jgi:hypothetical protein
VKIGYRNIQINGEWFTWDEREEKLKTKFLEGEKRRRTDEKRYKEKVYKKVDEQSKQNGKKHNGGKSLPKEYKWKGQEAKREKKKGRATGGITGVKLGTKEKRQENGEEERCMLRKVL